MLLTLIWQGTIVLSAFSVFVFLCLYIRRLIIQKREVKRDLRRAEIKKAVLTYISSPEPSPWSGNFQNPVDVRILLGIASELLHSLTGVMRTRILTLLNTAIDNQHMLAMLRDGTAGDRAKMAARLFWCRDPVVQKQLFAALNDPVPDVVLAAANSLIALDLDIKIDEFLPILKSRQMLHHRGSRDLIRRLARTNVEPLASAIMGEDIDITVLAIDAVGTLRHPALIAALNEVAIKHRNRDVRAAAIRALGNVGDPVVGPVIAEAMHDTSWEVKVQAAVAAGRLKLVSLAPQLAQALESDNWWLQWRSAQSLAKMGDTGERILRELPFDHPAAVLADIVLAEVHSA